MTEPSLDLAVIDFAHAVGLLLRRVRAASGSDELSWTGSQVMSRLAHDGPATTADLARAEGMKPQSMGTAIAGLESMGLVERKPHPSDGRQVVIELSAKGAELRRSSKDAKRAWLTEAIAKLDPEAQRTLFAAGEIIQRLAGA